MYRSVQSTFKTDLVTNYRSHYDLFSLLAKLFYKLGGNKPIPRDQAQCENQTPHPLFHPFSFYVYGDGKAVRGGRDGSYFNQKEAHLIVEHVEKIREKWPTNWGHVDLSKICVLSSEQVQVRLRITIFLSRIDRDNFLDCSRSSASTQSRTWKSQSCVIGRLSRYLFAKNC